RKRAEIETERTEAIDNARDGALAEVHDLLEQIRELGRTARNSHSEMTQLAAMRDIAVAAEREVVNRLKRSAPKAQAPLETMGPIKPGDTVFVRHLRQLAEVISEADAKGEIEVQLGSFKARVRSENVEKRSKRSARTDTPSALQATFSAAASHAAPLQLDLRGRRAEEVIPEVELYLNDAYLGGLPFVRLIHGKGTGALRQVVREQLTGHPLVRSFNAAEDRDGGDGVTIAILAQ
ncbi:MAG: Smr/MutS family protein, partial [Dehalococcoidia bacterium]|nr:Smr/MutS family protein [Dehalococcoidia bacterium]